MLLTKEQQEKMIDQYKSSFKADVFGGYAGIKKDDLTSGGAINPGFLFYNPVNNQFLGFRGHGEKSETKYLSDFEDLIVPDVLASQAVRICEPRDCPI